ncbi:MAG: OFA family MFS transporter [Candidatus Omnitrophica bacterium]|nr:OFA family MFS transporter [Candidatus Omnitrophota bacterium]
MKSRAIYPPLGMTILLCLGTIYSWSVFKKPLEALFNVGATESGMPFMIFLASFALAMPFAGFLIEKLGPRTTTIIGGVIVSAGWIIAGFAQSMSFISLAYGIIAGAGVGICYGAPLAVSAKWFPDKKGLALGITLVGFGLSAFITAPVARYLIATYGPLEAFKILGASFLVIITICAFFLRFPKEGEIQVTPAQAAADAAATQMTAGQMVKTPKFLGLWLCYTIGTLAGLMAIGITSPVGQDVIKLDAKTAAFMISLFAIFNGAGRPLFGYLTDKFGPKMSAIISYVLIIVASGLTLLFSEGSVVLYIISFATLWMILGGWLAIAPAATSSSFGAKNYAQNYGFVFTAYGAGAILGSLVSGFLKDTFGSYLYTFYLTAALGVLGIVIASATFKQK